jgi:hypothetical protein
MNNFQRSVSLYMMKARSVSTPREFRALAQEFLVDLCRLMVRMLTEKPPTTYDTIEYPTRNDDFWTSRLALFVYAVVFVSLLTRRSWIMHGVSLLAILKILKVLVKWADYTLEDGELRYACTYIRGWIGIFLNEGEKILSGEDAWKFAVTYSVVTTAPTGAAYLRYVIRYKTRALRKEFLSELGEDRFNRRQNGFLLRKLDHAISAGSKQISSATRRHVDKSSRAS